MKSHSASHSSSKSEELASAKLREARMEKLNTGSDEEIDAEAAEAQAQKAWAVANEATAEELGHDYDK